MCSNTKELEYLKTRNNVKSSEGTSNGAYQYKWFHSDTEDMICLTYNQAISPCTDIADLIQDPLLKSKSWKTETNFFSRVTCNSVAMQMR